MMNRPVLLTFVTMPNGDRVSMNADTILTDGTCLVAFGSKYYHRHAGCCLDWSKDAYQFFIDNGSWTLTTVKAAKKDGLLSCLSCDRAIWEMKHGR